MYNKEIVFCCCRIRSFGQHENHVRETERKRWWISVVFIAFEKVLYNLYYDFTLEQTLHHRQIEQWQVERWKEGRKQRISTNKLDFFIYLQFYYLKCFAIKKNSRILLCFFRYHLNYLLLLIIVLIILIKMLLPSSLLWNCSSTIQNE